MAVEKYGKGWRYRFRYTDPATGKKMWVTKAGFKLEREARAAERTALGRADRGEIVTTKKVMTVADWLEEFSLSVELSRRKTTAATYAFQARNYVVPHIGAMKLGSVSAVDIELLYRTLTTTAKRCRKCHPCRVRVPKGARREPCENPGPLASATVQGIHGFLVTAFGAAVRRGYIFRNPAAEVDKPTGQKPKKHIWTPEAAVQFLDYVKDDRFYPMWLVLLSTGLRRGELAGLTWESIDFRAGTVSIFSQRTMTVNNEETIGAPKTEKGRRIIPLSPRVLDALRDWRELQNEERAAFGEAYTDTQYLFTDADGVPIRPHRIRQRLNMLQEKAGVEVISVHNLRHTVATMLLAAGVHPKVVQEVLGHSSITVTLDMYTQVPQETLRAASDTLGLMLAPTGTEGPKLLEIESSE
jgi:integrase